MSKNSSYFLNENMSKPHITFMITLLFRANICKNVDMIMPWHFPDFFKIFLHIKKILVSFTCSDAENTITLWSKNGGWSDAVGKRKGETVLFTLPHNKILLQGGCMATSVYSVKRPVRA